MPEKLKVLTVFGTRPEAIKMAPVVRALAAHPQIDSRVCVTAQHREMLDQVLALFDIAPDYDLDAMRSGQSLTDVTTAILTGLRDVIVDCAPNRVLVHGDTTTTLAATLAAYYQHVPVGHVEAGLRTGDIYSPWPEEINRKLTAGIADLHFAPTEAARDNLRQEGIPEQRIIVTGNTVIDALLDTVQKLDNDTQLQARLQSQYLLSDKSRDAASPRPDPSFPRRRESRRHQEAQEVDSRLRGNDGDVGGSGTSRPRGNDGGVIEPMASRLRGNEGSAVDSEASPPGGNGGSSAADKKLILVTGHRRESFGGGFERICRALVRIAARDDVKILYPVHLNPNVQRPVKRLLGDLPNVHLIDPVDYLPFVYLMRQSYLILTDSGGVQEEAPGLGKPVLVMRDKTERQEAIEAGTVALVGSEEERIVSQTSRLLDNTAAYQAMSKAHNPYGDGQAAARIVNTLLAGGLQ